MHFFSIGEILTFARIGVLEKSSALKIEIDANQIPANAGIYLFHPMGCDPIAIGSSESWNLLNL